MNNKIVLCLEGIDGVGKTTIVTQIKKIFGSQCALYSRTQKSNLTQKIVSSKFMRKFKICQIPIYILLSHVNYIKFRKSSISSPIIVMDRCFLSNISYFFSASLKSVFFMRLIMLFEPRIFPQKIFILDVDPSVAQKRDNFQKDLAWLSKTRNVYLQASESLLLKRYQITVIKDNYSIEQKTDIIVNYIRENLERINCEKKIN